MFDAVKKFPAIFIRTEILPAAALMLMLLGLRQVVPAQDLPTYRSFVNDFAQVIAPQDGAHVEALLSQVRDRTGIEVAVVTVPSLNGVSVDEYSLDLARRWGIGQRKENTGLLLLVAPNDRKYRIEVGYGLEGELPDGLVGEIGRRMVPFFKNQRYSAGITRGVDVLVSTIAQARGVEISGSEKSLAFQRKQRSRRGGGGLLLLALLVIFVVIVAIAASNGGRGGGRRSRARRRGSSDWMWYPIIFSGGGSGGFGGHGGGGGSSWGGLGGGGGGGGFGGFGGGSFGGGGASGSW